MTHGYPAGTAAPRPPAPDLPAPEPAAPEPAPAAPKPGRDRYLDLLRSVALVRVVV
jgi:hypothetical protein